MTSGSDTTLVTGSRAEPVDPVEKIVRLYGDMLFDLCESVLWSSSNAQLAFRAILKDLRKRRPANSFETQERAWVLRLTVERLKAVAGRHRPQVTSSDQIKLDGSSAPEKRLGNFELYFHRLPLEEQILLLLKDKYGIPYPEIAAAMETPEGALKVQRQQALRALEEWLWDTQR